MRIDPHEPGAEAAAPPPLLLWAGVLAGPAGFLLNLQVGYTLVTMGCDSARPWLQLSALLAFALTVGGGGLAWREWRRTGREWPGDGEGALPRSRFLAALGVLTSTLFGIAILAQWLPTVILPPCPGP